MTRSLALAALFLAATCAHAQQCVTTTRQPGTYQGGMTATATTKPNLDQHASDGDIVSATCSTVTIMRELRTSGEELQRPDAAPQYPLTTGNDMIYANPLPAAPTPLTVTSLLNVASLTEPWWKMTLFILLFCVSVPVLIVIFARFLHPPMNPVEKEVPLFPIHCKRLIRLE